MLSQTSNTCDMAALKQECALVVGDAFHSCRNQFMASKPVSTKALLMVKDTSDFVNLAAQFTTDRHSVMNFADFLKQDLVETKVETQTGNSTNKTDADGPSAHGELKAVEHYARTAKHFAQVEKTEQKVKFDLHEAKVGGVPVKTYLPLYASLKKCRDLKRNTYMQCGKLMCSYVKTCGSKTQMKQCAREAAEDAAEKKTKEILYKHRRAVALAIFKHNQEVKAKAPELKAKANTKEKVYKRGAPERDAKEKKKKKVEKFTAEIRGKAAAQVAKWLPNHDGETYECKGIKDRCKWVKKKKTLANRRLLSGTEARTDITMESAEDAGADYILNAKAMEEKITKKQKKIEAKARKQEKYLKAVAKLQASPACKAASHTAFGKCHELTTTAYDICINVYDKATKNFTASHPHIDFVQIRAEIRAEKAARRAKQTASLAQTPPAKSLYQSETELFESELAMGQGKVTEDDDFSEVEDEVVPESAA